MIQPGMFVQCIDASNSNGALRRGAIYPVAAAYGRFICVEAGHLNGWFATRFRPAPDISSLKALLTSNPSRIPANQGA